MGWDISQFSYELLVLSAGGASNATEFKTKLGLQNVNNTADANKPISTLVQAALDLKSPTSHNHDGAYSAIGHNHDGVYSLVAHNHDGAYDAAGAAAAVAALLTAHEGGSNPHGISLAGLGLPPASQGEMETGTEPGLRAMSPLRVAQAIIALAPGGGGGASLTFLSQSFVDGSDKEIYQETTTKGTWEQASNATQAKARGFLGFRSGTSVVRIGPVTGVDLSGVTGPELFLGPDGTFVDNPGTAEGVVARYIGYKRSDTELWFEPDNIYGVEDGATGVLIVHVADAAALAALDNGYEHNEDYIYITDDDGIKWGWNGSAYVSLVAAGAGGGIASLSEDPSPTLSANLDTAGFGFYMNGARVLQITGLGASALNYVAIINNVAPDSPVLAVDGPGEDVGLDIFAKGAGVIRIGTSRILTVADVGAVSGVCPLDGSQKVPAANLPSYVDDVVEAADFASLPGTGETGKIYVTLDDGKVFRWTGSVYVEISSTPTGATIKALYEAEADTNAYTDAEKAKVAKLPTSKILILSDAAVTLDQDHNDRMIILTHASPTVTIPLQSAETFSDFQCSIVARGGAATLTGSSGVDINGVDAPSLTIAVNEAASVARVGDDDWWQLGATA